MAHSTRITRMCICALGLAFLIFPYRRVDAQVLYGSIVGNVTDLSGAVVPGAHVTATDVGTKTVMVATTNGAGVYVLNDVPAGTYIVSIAKAGFATFRSSNFTVVINTAARVNARLQVGKSTQTVTVSAGAIAELETDREDVHADLSATDLENLPQPTRVYEGVLGILPGFDPPSASSGGTNDPLKSMDLEANGSSDEGTDVRIGGVSDVDPWVQFFSAAVPSEEAIQSVNVVTGSPDVEQGLANGATINVEMKSGTNQFHGELFEFNTNQAVEALPDFSPAGYQNSKAIENDLGGNLGGPILKNKLFFFTNFEGDYTREDSPTYSTVPTAAEKNGDFSATGTTIYNPDTGNTSNGEGRTPFPGDIIPSSMLSPITAKLNALVPAPNTSFFGVYSSNYFTASPSSYNLEMIDSKVDWYASSKLHVSGRLDIDPYSDLTTPVFGPVLGGAYATPNQHGLNSGITGDFTYTFSPTFLVDGSFGYNRTNQLLLPIDPNEKYTADVVGIPGTNLGNLPEAAGLATINIGGYTNLGEGYNYLHYDDPVFEEAANFTKIKGTHTVKFGFNIMQQHMNHIETGPDTICFSGDTTVLNAPGAATATQFSGYADFLLGLPTSWENYSLNLPADPELYMRTDDYSLYVGDEWQATKKLTLNLGMGWEYYPVPNQVTHGLGEYVVSKNIYEICGTGGIPENCGISVSPHLFTPRVGIAYRPASTLVFRAGYSLANEQFPMARDDYYNFPENLRYSATDINPYVPVGSLSAGIPIPTAPPTVNGVIPSSDLPPGFSFETEPLNFVRGKEETWNISVQKSFGSWVAQVAYVGTHSYDGHSRTDINYGTVGGGVASEPLYILNGWTSAEAEILPQIASVYDALQTSLTRHFAHGFSLMANYTWSNWWGVCCSTDANSAPNIVIPQYFYLNDAAEPGDYTQIFNLAAIGQSPFGRGKKFVNSGVGAALLGGWQLSGVFTTFTGSPFSISADGTTLNAPGSTQRANQVLSNVSTPHLTVDNDWFNPYAFQPVTTAAFGTAGFDSVFGPGAIDFDLGLSRNIRMSERFTLQIRAEAYNVGNTPNYSDPGSCVCSVAYATNSNGTPDYSKIINFNGFDQITGTNAYGRLIAQRYFRFGAKFMW